MVTINGYEKRTNSNGEEFNVLVLAGVILDINLLDHLIITSEEYLSFADQNLT